MEKLWYYESEKSVKIGTDDWNTLGNRVTPRTFGVGIVESRERGAIREDHRGNAQVDITPASLSRLYSPKGAMALGQPPAGGWYPRNPSGTW